jgi:hypothetical protein
VFPFEKWSCQIWPSEHCVMAAWLTELQWSSTGADTSGDSTTKTWYTITRKILGSPTACFFTFFSYIEYIKSISICTSKCCPLPNAKWKSSSKAVFYERTARFSMYFWCIILLTKEFSTDVFLC